MRAWLSMPAKAAAPPQPKVQPKAKGHRGPGKKKAMAQLVCEEGETVPELPPAKKARTAEERIADLEAQLAKDQSARELELEQAVRNAAERVKEAEAKLTVRRGSTSSFASSVSPESKELQAEFEDLLGVRLAMFREAEFENPGRLYQQAGKTGSTPEGQAAVGKVLGAALGGAAGGEQGKVSGHLGGPAGKEKGELGAKFGELGAKSGIPGAEFGHLGARFGKLGGRPKSEKSIEGEEAIKVISEGHRPEQWLKTSIGAGLRFEPAACTVVAFKAFCDKKLQERGEECMSTGFMQQLQEAFFRGRKTRQLLSLYNDRKGKAARLKEIGCGARGGPDGHGQHGQTKQLKQGKSLGTRLVTEKALANRKSALASIFDKVRICFEAWRSAGQYVDREDLLIEFEDRLKKKITELELKKVDYGVLSGQDAKVLHFAEKRLASHKRDAHNREKSADQMQRLFNARLLKPQRLVSMTTEQEAQKIYDTWHHHDAIQQIAAFGTPEELSVFIVKVDEWIQHRKTIAKVFSDQMPYYVKLKPGKQLYAEGEYKTSANKPLTAAEKEQAMGVRSGGGSQKASTLLKADEEEKAPSGIDAEGQTQTRGESHQDQDKFRITVDLEQVLFNWYDPEKDPVADFGLTSVIITGTHFREHNVDENNCWIEDEHFFVKGEPISRTAGRPVEKGLGSSLLNFRKDHPELYKEMKDLGIRFYQQPAGFEDAVITDWKVREQHKQYGLTHAVRDMFTGGLAETTKIRQAQCQQVQNCVSAKVTAVIQLADVAVIRPVKLKTIEKHAKLRKELMRLAEFQGTRAIFKCGTYEIFRTLCDVIRECTEDFRKDKRLLKAMYYLGYLCLRPDYNKGKLVKTQGQAWCQTVTINEEGEEIREDWVVGSHRMRAGWIEHRFDHVDEDGKVKPVERYVNETGLPAEVEQTYMTEPSDKHTSATWDEMVKSGELSQRLVDEWKSQDWYTLEISSFHDIDGLEEYKEMLKTPAQLRKERGIDPKLTSQKQDLEKKKAKAAKAELTRLARKPLRKEAIEQIRELTGEGYSMDQIATQVGVPAVGGKGKSAKKKLRDSIANKMKAKKAAEQKAKDAAEGKSEETQDLRASTLFAEGFYL